MRLNDGREPKYYLKSQKARKTSLTITQSLLGSVTLSFLVFGPGKKSKEFHSHRVPVKNLIKKLNQTAAFPEDIEVPLGDDPVAKALADNLATKELYLMNEYDYTVILLMSVGSISEFSSGLTNSVVAHKIRLYIPRRQRKSSYLMTGPVKAFNEAHRQVHYFNDPADLLKKIEKMVKGLLVLRAFQN